MDADVDPDGLRVFLYDRKDPIIFRDEVEICAEDICLQIAKELNISLLTFPLFGLVDKSYKNWLSPEKKIQPSSFTPKELYFRIRFSVSKETGIELQALKTKDPAFIEYLFFQCRTDFTQDSLCTLYGGSKKLNKEECMGMAVVIVLCFAKKNNIDIGNLDKNSFRNNIPKSVRSLVCRKYHFVETSRFQNNFFRKMKELEVEEEKIENLYLRIIHAIYSYFPNYLLEIYEARVEHDHVNGYRDDQTIMITPNKEIPCIGRLRDIHSLELRRNDSRDNEGFEHIVQIFTDGRPKIFLFKKIQVAESFVSALNGYYRLSVNYYLCLSKKMAPPSLCILDKVGCHGAISGKRRRRMLVEREGGSYIVCQSDSCDLSQLELVYRKPGSSEISQLQIEALSDGSYRFKDEDRKEENLLTLLLEDDRTSGLINSVARGAGDGLLLCKDEDVESKVINRPASNTNALLVSRTDMSYTEDILGNGYYTQVREGNMVTRNKQTRETVAVKILRQDQKYMPQCLEFFTRAADDLQQMQSEFIVKLLGICLHPPTRLLLELANDGDLEKYLQLESNQIQPFQIMQATVSVMKALHYLSKESVGLVHGNVRCRNILVFSTRDYVNYKLADPGMTHLYNVLPLQHPCNQERLPWLAPELHQNLSSITHQTDLFALGTTAWEMWALGRHPPHKRSRTEGEYPPVPAALHQSAEESENTAEIRDTIMRLISSCHQDNPQNRMFLPELLRDILPLINVASHRPCKGYQHSGSSCSKDCTILDVEHPPSLQGLSFNAEYSLWCFEEPRVNGTENMTQHFAGAIVSLPHREGRPLPPNPSQVQHREVDKMIGRDKVTKQHELGSGHFGVVYKAQLQVSPTEVKPCAMKTLWNTQTTAADDSLWNTQTAVPDDSLLKEMRIMCTLSHENVVKLYGFCARSETEPFCILMEFVENGSLEKALQESRNPGYQQDSLTDEVLYSICKGVAQGMNYLASKRIVHRDLAARNVLLTRTWQIKITDFGLARMIGEKEYYKSCPEQLLPLSYYAPEAVSHQRFRVHSDVWTYGILLWEIYTRGERPPTFSPGELREDKRLSKPPNCPQEAYHLMREMCWRWEPLERPSFSEIVCFISDHYNWDKASDC